MRYFYKCMLGVMLILISNGVCAQWVSTVSTIGSVTFETPTAPILYTQDSINLDTNTIVTSLPNIEFYHCPIDSYISLQVHLVDSAIFNINDDLLDSILAENSGDTLRTIAQFMYAFTTLQLIHLDTVNAPVSGLDIGFMNDNDEYIFSRFFITNNKFYSFTVTGTLNDLPAVILYRDQFFNSIQF